MSNYVLEILDGDQAGEVFSLPEGRVRIGRRPDNELVLQDEKCSGHHAELTFEDGRYVLRDLDSTNGTMLDGRKVTEIALSPFDKFQLGRVRILFKEAGATTPDPGLEIARFDEAVLRRSRRRRGSLAVGLLGVVVVLGGGAAAYLQWFAGETRQGPRTRAPDRVSGNLLAAAPGADNFEEDGAWNLHASTAGVPFDVLVGRTIARSGNSALAAVGGAGDDDAVGRFALAQLRAPIRVGSGSPIALTGHLRTAGRGTGALRLLFTSSADSSQLRAGTVPTAAEQYQKVELKARVPAGMDRVQVEVLALLPDADSEVLADDIALVPAPGADVVELELSSENGRNLHGVGASVYVFGTDSPTLLGVDPLVSEQTLVDLSRAGLCVPSDAGLSLSVDDLDGQGFRLRFAREGERADGLALLFPPEAAGVMARGAEDGARFVPEPPAFDLATVREVLLGSVEGRCVIALEPPARVVGALDPQGYRLELPGTLTLELRTVFDQQSRAARDRNRAAAAARDRGDFAEALDQIEALLEQSPHDLRAVRAARQMRAEIVAGLDQRVRELETEAAGARFFEAMVGYRRVIDGIDRLIEAYGERHLPQIDELRRTRAAMADAIAAQERRSGREHGRKLAMLVEAFDNSGQPELAKLVRGYIEQHYADVDDSGDDGDRDGEGR